MLTSALLVPSAADKKRAESKDQQLKALLARIDELQAEQQQLQDAATAAQSQAGNLSTLLSTCRTQLQDSRDQHRMEVEALEQQLAAAQQRLQRNNSDGLNNTAEVENFRKQAAANKADADAANKAAFAYKAEADAALVELQLLKQQLSAASARADQAVKEKQLLLENMQNLLRLNTVLQATLKAEREQQVGP
jgi:chromosome segregation ATPase